MSYSQMKSIPRPFQADEHLQRQLQSLLQQLGWSYVALWTFNHQTRNLGWRGGHFGADSAAMTDHGDREVWNEHLFNSTYKSCTFAPSQGPVGIAYEESRNIWMNGPSVHRSAGSKEQAQFLQHAGIETAVCIPWAKCVLELGTCVTVAENLDLTANLCTFLSEHILPALGQAPPSVSQSSPAASRAMMQSGPFPLWNPTIHLPEKILNQDFEPNPLNEPIIRPSSPSSMKADMFLQQLEEGEVKELGNGLDTGFLLTDPRWRSPTTTPTITTRGAGIVQTRTPLLLPPSQGRSHSGTVTSSSVSVSEDGSSQRRNSHSNTSSSSRRGTPSHSSERTPIGDTNTATEIPTSTQNLRVQEEGIQPAISQMLDEGDVALDTDQEQWRDIYSNPSLEPGNAMSEVNLLDSSSMPNMNAFQTQVHPVRAELQQPAFESWRHARAVAPALRKFDGTNQSLLRRCIVMMKLISNLQQGTRTHGSVAQNISPHGPRLTSSSSLESLPDFGTAHDPFGQMAPVGGQRRPVHAGHDEAAVNHMMAERRRRVKQRENFAALRKLVPILSKADKASTLGDTIVYIKDLQEQAKKLEASKDRIESRYENLKKNHQDLEQRNKELEAMAGNNGMQHSGPRLHSMQSS